jgi:hypothetical protein
MQTTTHLDPYSALNTSAAIPSLNEPAAENVIAALVEALSGSEHYELIERDGELFVRPVRVARQARAVAPAFSPDARARSETLAMAA